MPNVANTQTDSESDTLASVLFFVSDSKSLSLFNMIANMSNPSSADRNRNPGNSLPISRTNMTRKQYYTRINRLREAGLIRRSGARFILTSLGTVIFEIHRTITLAIRNRWRLQAIDSLDSSLSAAGMPNEEKHKLISALMGDHEVIRDILLQQIGHVTVKNNYTSSTLDQSLPEACMP